MNNLVDKIIILNIDEIESYKFPLDEPFGLQINYEEVKYCFIIKLSSNNKNLICCGTGAQQRDKKTSNGIMKKPPYLDRWSWFKYFDESFIVPADPTFFYDAEITLGWFVGNKKQWYVEIASNIIKKICINQNINQNNILFYGSSGGGFVSICMGTLIKDSKVLVNNTQFSILNYYDTHKNNLFKLLKEYFPNSSQGEIIKKINYRLDTIELFKKEKYFPPITYYINLESKPDLIRHCLPFIDEIKNLKFFHDNFTIHFYREKKENPHGPLPTITSIQMIKKFAKEHLYNE